MFCLSEGTWEKPPEVERLSGVFVGKRRRLSRKYPRVQGYKDSRVQGKESMVWFAGGDAAERN